MTTTDPGRVVLEVIAADAEYPTVRDPGGDQPVRFPSTFADW